MIDLSSLIAAEPIKGAWISEDTVHRYALWRTWNGTLPRLTVCMLNPSTADARKDDPTIRRLISFAAREGYGGLLVVNLFAYRTAHPSELCGRGYSVIVGPENNAIVEAAIPEGSKVLLGWGAFHWGVAGGRTRRDDVLGYLRHVGASAFCLGLTSSGEPRHPLYIRSDQPFVEFAL